MTSPVQQGDRDDIHSRTASAHQKMLVLLAAVAPREFMSTGRRQDGGTRDNSPTAQPEVNQRFDKEGIATTQGPRFAMTEWTENRLADFNLWITGLDALDRSEASLETPPSFNLGDKMIIETLLQLLESFLDSCRTFASYDAHLQSNKDAESTVDPEESSSNASDGYLSPWSDESSDPADYHSNRDRSAGNAVGTSSVTPNIRFENRDLAEAMKGVELILSQLIRLGFKIRQATDERSIKANSTFEAVEHSRLRQELISMLKLQASLSTHRSVSTQNDPGDGLSNVQIRMVDSVFEGRGLLQYICPVEDCDTPDICYGSAEYWKSHVYKDHTRTTYWRCPACTETIHASHEFVLHIQQRHDNIIDSDLLSDFAESCKQFELARLTCPVCGDNSSCTLDVIGEHIRLFFQESLPFCVAKSEMADQQQGSISDSSQQLMTGLSRRRRDSGESRRLPEEMACEAPKPPPALVHQPNRSDPRGMMPPPPAPIYQSNRGSLPSLVPSTLMPPALESDQPLSLGSRPRRRGSFSYQNRDAHSAVEDLTYLNYPAHDPSETSTENPLIFTPSPIWSRFPRRSRLRSYPGTEFHDSAYGSSKSSTSRTADSELVSEARSDTTSELSANERYNYINDFDRGNEDEKLYLKSYRIVRRARANDDPKEVERKMQEVLRTAEEYQSQTTEDSEELMVSRLGLRRRRDHRRYDYDD